MEHLTHWFCTRNQSLRREIVPLVKTTSWPFLSIFLMFNVWQRHAIEWRHSPLWSWQQRYRDIKSNVTDVASQRHSRTTIVLQYLERQNDLLQLKRLYWLYDIIKIMSLQRCLLHLKTLFVLVVSLCLCWAALHYVVRCVVLRNKDNRRREGKEQIAASFYLVGVCWEVCDGYSGIARRKGQHWLSK